MIWLLTSILVLNIIELFINLWCSGNCRCHCCSCNFCDEKETKKSSNELARRTNEKNTERITVKHQEQSVNEVHKGAVIATDGNNIIIGTMKIQSHRKRNRWTFAFSDDA